MDKFTLVGKKGVLTGAAGWFGAHFAEALLDAGIDKIFLLDKNISGLEKLKTRLVAKGYSEERFFMRSVDQYDLLKTKEMFDEISGAYPINLLINNSFDFSVQTGFNDPSGRIENATFDQLNKAFISGIYWPIEATQHFANKAVANGEKLTIVNIGSMYSLVVPHPSLYEGTPYFNPPGYSMAKSAVLAFTRYAASFYSPSVRANAICPGAIPNTEQESPNAVKKDDFNFQQRLVDRTLLKRVGHPDDLVGALVFLSSEASSYMTGQHIVIDGGWVIT